MRFLSLIVIIIFSFLLGVVITGIIGGTLYLSLAPTTEKLLNELVFEKTHTSFGNGGPSGTLWSSDTSILAKVSTLRTFLPIAEWNVSSIPDPDLPLFFTLPEPARSVRTYIATQSGILPLVGPDNLIGVLLSPSHLGLKFAHGEVPTDTFFTGNDIGGFQDLAVIIVYTTL